jgi:hypothetical protein
LCLIAKSISLVEKSPSGPISISNDSFALISFFKDFLPVSVGYGIRQEAQ